MILETVKEGRHGFTEVTDVLVVKGRIHYRIQGSPGGGYAEIEDPGTYTKIKLLTSTGELLEYLSTT